MGCNDLVLHIILGMGAIEAPGGVCTTRDLLAAGYSQGDIRRELAAGNLLRPRRGWYALPNADAQVLRAVRAGGALTCASALAHHGAWQVDSGTLHLRIDHNRTGGLPDGMKRCRTIGNRHARAPRRAVDHPDEALRAAWWCLGREDFLIVAESLVERRLMSPAQIRLALGSGPGVEDVLGQMDRGESGPETVVRLRLRARRINVRAQVAIGGVGRVDLLVGERLVIEVDSRAFHTGEERYRRDRERDLRLRALGYIVVRLTYEQVMHSWPETEQALLVMIRRGDHWWASRRGRWLPQTES
ncbi:DUF559 domain-containing protein [Luteococcus sp. OSA5]|uniref:DUF559 domain-containing protein n=1 Tax=Luteococcus sp. OSA5 TaxID=3401630 RepID=UPI003B42E6E2